MVGANSIVNICSPDVNYDHKMYLYSSVRVIVEQTKIPIAYEQSMDI